MYTNGVFGTGKCSEVPDFGGCDVHKQGAWDRQTCPDYQGVLFQNVLTQLILRTIYEVSIYTYIWIYMRLFWLTRNVLALV